MGRSLCVDVKCGGRCASVKKHEMSWEVDKEDSALDNQVSAEQLPTVTDQDLSRPEVEFQQLHDQEDTEQQANPADSTTERRAFMAKLVALAAINVSESFHVNVIWSMAPFMMQDLGVPEPQIGGWVGCLSAAFFGAQLLSSPAWGYLADRVGRRPTLLLGVLGAGVSILLLGLNHSIGVNIGARALAGFLNGNIGISKTYLAEIVTDRNRSAGFSTLAFCWGLGTLIAPAIGGFFSRPAVKYPDVFGSIPLFVDYPFMLPCMCVCAVSLFGFVYGFINLAETPPFVQRKLAAAVDRRVQVGDAESGSLQRREEATEEAGCWEGLLWLWHSKHTVTLVSIYAVLAAHALVFEELWPVLCKAPTPSEGGQGNVGLGFDTDKVGMSLMIGGGLLMPFQLLIYPRVADHFGSRQVMLSLSLLLVPMYLGVPALAYLAESSTAALWAGIVAMQLIKVVCYASIFTSAMVLLACACDGPHLAFANGVAQSCGSATRMAAPLAGGWIWSYSLTLDVPFRQWLVYSALCCLTLVSRALVFRLPPGLDRTGDGIEVEIASPRSAIAVLTEDARRGADLDLHIESKTNQDLVK